MSLSGWPADSSTNRRGPASSEGIPGPRFRRVPSPRGWEIDLQFGSTVDKPGIACK